MTIASGATYVVAADLNRDTVMDAIVAKGTEGLVPLVRTASAIDAATPPGPTPAPDFNLVLNPSSGTVTSGSSVSSTINLTFSSGFNQAVSFSCASLPANARCMFSPATVNPTTAATTTMTIATGGALAARAGGSAGSHGLPWGLLGVGTIGLAGMARRRRRPSWRLWSSWMIAILLGMGLSSCGGEDNGNQGSSPPVAATPTPAGSYTIAVTATSGSITKTVLYTLTVK